MKKIVIALMVIATLANADFSKSGNIVTDSTTGLQWQDDAIGSTSTWQKAIDRCEALVLDGHDDWRLPIIKELESIVDRSKGTAPTINSVFQNTTSDYYWSSTAVASYTSSAWAVNFGNSSANWYDKSNSVYVRCVR